MRVIHVTASITANGGGIPIALQSLASAQINSGISCKVIGHDDGGTPISAWPVGVVCPLPIRRFPGMPWAAKMVDQLQRTEPALLHTHGLWSQGSIIVPRASHRVRIPYLVSPHGMLDPWALANSRWKKRIAAGFFENRHLEGADCLHALCSSEADAIRAYGLKKPVAIIPNGIDLPEDRGRETGDGSQDSGRKQLLFLGRLHPKKGLVNALRAWATLHSKLKTQNSKSDEWTFVIAGWDQGGHEAELKRLCDELGLKWDHVSAAEFVGGSFAEQGHLSPQGESATVVDTPLHSSFFQSTINNQQSTVVNLPSVIFTGPAFGEAKDVLLRSASAFILPSFSEGLPMSVLEAWSYQLPVLMTDHCNLPEGFAANAAIRIGTDVESIAEGMRQLFSLPTTDNRQQTTSLSSLGQNGRQLVSERFTWPKVAAQMKEVYEWVLGGGEKPECMRHEA